MNDKITAVAERLPDERYVLLFIVLFLSLFWTAMTPLCTPCTSLAVLAVFLGAVVVGAGSITVASAKYGAFPPHIDVGRAETYSLLFISTAIAITANYTVALRDYHTELGDVNVLSFFLAEPLMFPPVLFDNFSLPVSIVAAFLAALASVGVLYSIIATTLEFLRGARVLARRGKEVLA